ncbi:MAG: hypothetical protein V1797_14525 [Pseudomonadota bacterium]
MPPEVRRFSGLYRFIAPERFAELGIDPEDVPLGTFPAEDHPPFLPDRFGGNAYGLGLFEQAVLTEDEARLLDSLELTKPAQVAEHHGALNDVLKRLGLLVRYSALGRPFYLIPRQFVAHFLVEVRAKADLIAHFLGELMARRLRETMRVALVSSDSELLLPELQGRLPHLDLVVIDNLEALTARRKSPFAAVVMVGDPRNFALRQLSRAGLEQPRDRARREAYGYFMAGRFYDLLEEEGEVLALADRPLGSSRETLSVQFRGQDEFKRFLLFSHVYRTRRRYKSAEGLTMLINRFDFNAFLTGLGVYHETVEGLLGGRSMPRVEPKEIDALDYQDLPLPRGSAPRLLAAWRRWFGPYFHGLGLTTVLPDMQKREWEERYRTDGEFPPTQVVYEGRRRRPPMSLISLETQAGRRHLVGCDRLLLADYKNSLDYVLKVLAVLTQVRDGAFTSVPGLELSRLRKPFETAQRHPQTLDVLALMDLAPRLARLGQRLNPDRLMGSRTPVLENLEKFSLLGLEEGHLSQLYLIVLGHSTMTRVTFGKLPETTLRPLTDLSRYHSLEEAVAVIRLYRLLSVAEAAAASDNRLSSEQVEEMFSLYDNAIRVVTDQELDWNDILDDQISRMGGVQAKAARKMLKLFDLFEFLERWRDLEQAGPRAKEAMADYDPAKLARIQEVIELLMQGRRFVGRFYAGDSSARPYFFRALLNCELHGTGRLLARLGTAAGFTLLWICVHTSERRLINMNRLLEVEPGLIEARLGKLRRALAGLPPDLLSPEWLSSLRDSLTRQGEAYVRDSGLFLSLDQSTGALTPRFVDVLEELAQLKRELNLTLGLALTEVPDERLAAMDRRAHAVGRFIRAQEGQGRGNGPGNGLGPGIAQEHSGLTRQLEHYLLDELFILPTFADNLRRLVEHCPHLLDRLLPQPTGHPITAQRLSAAAKLSALYQRRLDGFQDMAMSHDLARAEFGPAAAGIVGVSPLQFQTLTASLTQLLATQPRLEILLMLAVLLYNPESPHQRGRPDLASPLAHRLELARALHLDLDFLLAYLDRPRQVITGEASLVALDPLLSAQDPPLVEALFLLAVIATAARQEGLVTEDLLEALFHLQNRVRGLTRNGHNARWAQERAIEDGARQQLACEHYLEIQRGDAPTASLRQLLETTTLPSREPERGNLLGQGRLNTGLERLLKLRGLPFITALDLTLLRADVPVPYIYRLKNLRSQGITHFERDLYEGLRLYRGLLSLPRQYQGFVLNSLADPSRGVRLAGFAAAAERLTYPNQVRLLLLGLAAAAKLELGSGGLMTVSFTPLARVMETKFEMVNEAFSQLEPGAILNSPRALARLLGAREGLTLHPDPLARTISVDMADLARFDRKIEAVRRASTPAKLKRIYHEELRRLKLTTYSTLDYQRRLAAAFAENLVRLGEAAMERARQRMSAEDDLDRLEALFQAVWEEGLELPLGQDRQQSLRDLFEMNVERLRARLLETVSQRLAGLESFAELDQLWQDVRPALAQHRRHFGKDFDLLLAARFDQRASELRHETGAAI